MSKQEPTIAADCLRAFWAQNFPELSLVRKSTYNALDALIRADERERVLVRAVAAVNPTYRGPIIERRVEGGIVNAHEHTDINKAYALAVDEETGELVLVVEVSENPGHYNVSYYNPTFKTRREWTVTP